MFFIVSIITNGIKKYAKIRVTKKPKKLLKNNFFKSLFTIIKSFLNGNNKNDRIPK